MIFTADLIKFINKINKIYKRIYLRLKKTQFKKKTEKNKSEAKKES